MNRAGISAAALTFPLLLTVLLLPAQQAPVENARVETRSAAAGLEPAFRPLVEAQAAPAWIGYSVPAVPGRHGMCGPGENGCCRCRLEESSGGGACAHGDQPVELESPGRLLVLFRVEAGRTKKIRVFSGACRLDAGGLPFFWLTDVRPAESVALLASFVTSAGAGDADEDDDKLNRQALAAIALHADPAADATLERFVDPRQPEWLRGKTSFWLGAVRGRRGYEVLRRVMRDDPSPAVRKKVVFALSVSEAPEAVEAIIEAARNDPSPRVRGQALFWLAQKAGKKAAAAIGQAIEADPNTDVKKRAVFALSQLPQDEGVPLLIQVARTNRNPEVRKKAIFWLGQSNDPRALAFFEELLTR